ncbi:MAG: hypothetical protein RML12_05840 [Xanthomonadales bacterium]|nr:hypothetical protein [Xanthomonadales bacterium]
MTVRLAPLLLLALAHALPAPARAEQWFALYLDGRKIGQARAERELRDGLVHTRQRLEIALERGGVRIGVVTEEESVETEDGRPVALAGLTEFSGQAARRYRGEIRDGRLSLELDRAPRQRAARAPLAGPGAAGRGPATGARAACAPAKA